MAYIVDNNPAGKNPRRGWVTNLRGLGAYVRSKNPSGMRGLGCGCKSRRLGDDDSYTGLNPDGSVDTSWIAAGAPGNPAAGVSVPAGYGYGPSESGAVALYPAGAGNVGPYATSLPSSPSILPSLSFSTSPSLVSATPLSSSNGTLWLLGGAGLLAVVLIASKRR